MSMGATVPSTLTKTLGDHTHKETLLEVHPSTPVFATQKAADVVNSFHHFNQVYVIPIFSGKESDWRSTSTRPLPGWIGISRITSKSDALYFHSALMITFDKVTNTANKDGENGQAEAIIYSPHGIIAEDLRPLHNISPHLKVLCLLHGLDDIEIRFTAKLNLGAVNGLRAQRICQAKYWVGTHDEVKGAGGLIAPLLRRKQLTIQEVVEREKQDKGYISESSELISMQDVKFANLASGESILLE